MSFLPLVRLWLWVSAFASAAGWTLSACGQLNRAGYGIAFTGFPLFPFAATKGIGFGPRWPKFLRRKNFCAGSVVRCRFASRRWRF